MGIFGSDQVDKLEKIGNLEVFYGEKLIFVELILEKYKVELYQFLEEKYKEGYKLIFFQTLHAASSMPGRKICVLEK